MVRQLHMLEPMRLFIEIGGEADGSLLGFGQVHELTEGFEDADDGLIMRRHLPLQLHELFRELSIGREEMTQLQKRCARCEWSWRRREGY